MSRAASISTGEIFVMPSVKTSSKVTRELKAMEAKMAIFAAASNPPTSAVGSASAKPFCCASCRASS